MEHVARIVAGLNLVTQQAARLQGRAVLSGPKWVPLVPHRRQRPAADGGEARAAGSATGDDSDGSASVRPAAQWDVRPVERELPPDPASEVNLEPLASEPHVASAAVDASTGAAVDVRHHGVPSHPVTRAMHFGGLGLGLAAGAASAAVRRAAGAAEPTDLPLAMSEANVERLASTLCRLRGAALKVSHTPPTPNATTKQLPQAIERPMPTSQPSPTPGRSARCSRSTTPRSSRPRSAR